MLADKALGSQAAFHFITHVLSGLEARALWRPVQAFFAELALCTGAHSIALNVIT